MHGLNLKKTEAGTRMERLSSTNMGVPGAWSQPEEDGGGDKAGALILDQYGGPRTEEDGGGDKAGALILNQYGGPRCMVST